MKYFIELSYTKGETAFNYLGVVTSRYFKVMGCDHSGCDRDCTNLKQKTIYRLHKHSTLVRRSKGPCDNRTDHPLAPKPTVLVRNDINSFCRYPNYNQKLLIQFFTKSLSFLAKLEKPVFMPRPVSKASHQVPTLIRKKG